MPKIFELDSHVADLIAAGEVVERPASVVKELIENSIDAGAGIITVEISAGGMTYIRITDNGCGIAPEDVKTAFLRHATSKLRTADGLESISTLGFRGEALAAIAAVSRIELLTREAGAKEGVSLMLEAGTVVNLSSAGCPEGTTIIVRDLFFNTPARLKFMKSDRAESSAVGATVLRAALANPGVSVRFIKDGKTEYHTPGDSRVDSCVYSLFGRDFAAGLIDANTTDETVFVSGYVSTPNAARGNRSYQYFFVNGRPIKSMVLQTALEKAYANYLHSGRFPSCVLYITTRLGDVDVNVHPAKTEVKFVSDKQIFDGVYYAVLSALEKSSSGLRENMQMSEASNIPSPSTNSISLHENSRSSAPNFGSSKLSGSVVTKGGGFKNMSSDEFRKQYVSEDIKPYNNVKHVTHSNLNTQGLNQNPKIDAAADAPVSDISGSNTGSVRLRVIGEALRTYIIVEYSSGVWFIDKHAAHERLHFNALKDEGFEPMSEALITPVICRLGAADAALLLENSKLLERLGFEIESFGEDSVAARSIPAEIEIEDSESVLSDICELLKHGGFADAARLDDIYKTIACKAAIKAGKTSERFELEVLAKKVMSGEASHCPHGRPVAFEITKAQLDKGFKRI